MLVFLNKMWYTVTDRPNLQNELLEVFPVSTFLNVLIVILFIVVVALAVLYFLGKKLEKRQVEQQQALEAAAQTVTMLVIDKK